MKKLFEHLKDILEQEENAVLVTVVASSGSTPAEPEPGCW